MTCKQDIQEWLASLALDATDFVAIDEGGLTLLALDLNGNPNGQYLEVGGVPNEEGEVYAQR